MRHIKTILFLVLLLGGAQAFASGEKALVTGYHSTEYLNTLDVDVTFLNTSGVLHFQGGLYVSAVGLATEAAIRDAIISMVVDQAVSQWGYSSFTAKDILFFNYQTGAADQTAAKGWLSGEIDGKATGNTTVYTNNTGRDLVVDNATVILTDVAGLGTSPLVSIGKTSSSYNDIATSMSLSGLGTIGNMAKVTLSSSVPLVHNGESVVCRVSTAAILTTTYKFKCLIAGRFLD